MTMLLKIRNEDSSRTAKISVRDHAQDGSVHVVQEHEVRPGEEQVVYIHSSRDLLVEEQPDSQAP